MKGGFLVYSLLKRTKSYRLWLAAGLVVALLVCMFVLGVYSLWKWGWPGALMLTLSWATAVYIFFWTAAWAELVEHVERMRAEGRK